MNNKLKKKINSINNNNNSKNNINNKRYKIKSYLKQTIINNKYKN